MTPIEKAYRNFLREVRKTPVPQAFDYIHEHLRTLAASNYFNPAEPSSQADQFAAAAKFLFLFGPNKTTKRWVTITNLFNRYKDFWSVAEEQNPYSSDAELLAVFVLRFEYQQQPFRVFLDRVPQMFRRTRQLYLGSTAGLGETAVNPLREFERLSEISLESFLLVAEALYPIFKRRVHWDQVDLATQLAPREALLLPAFLKLMSSGKAGFHALYEQTKANSLVDVPYDFNPLLRFPILHYEGHLCAPFPELIPYAATRGLFFYLSDVLKGGFSRVFGNLFAAYAANITASKMGAAKVLREEDERSLGWIGKTNDFTLLLEDRAVLFECKTSVLFLSAKKHATLEEVRQDLKKNLVNPDAKKGLFQLHEKIEAIKSKRLPPELNRRYDEVKTFYPVILLYDQIQFANKPEALRNVLDAELAAAGIANFQYQVWHVEELENLFELVALGDVSRVITEKFEMKQSVSWDLNTHLYHETGKQYRYLNPVLFLPKGDTPALRILRSLSHLE
jgi:hypothetical protein